MAQAEGRLIMPMNGNFDDRLSKHRLVWQRKKTLRSIYGDYHRLLLNACPPRGPVLDIGGGSAHSKSIRSDVTTLDILPFPGIDVVADAHLMPFADSSYNAATMLDVLHHLERPVPFLREVARVLKVGGRLAMIEPAITAVSWWFYRFLHHEPVEMRVDPFAMTDRLREKDPFDSNQAIPTLLFGNEVRIERTEQAVTELRLISVDWLSLVAYPLSGGFKRWCLFPASWVPWTLAIEQRVPHVFRRVLAFRLFVVLEKIARPVGAHVTDVDNGRLFHSATD